MASSTTPDYNKNLYTSLVESDPEVQNIIDKEIWRQFTGLELIASENLTSRAAMEANGSILTNKYSEGYPGARYYGGNEYIDELEILCKKRALEAFGLDEKVWGVNVQPYSGSTANFAALTAMIQPNDRIMGLGLPDGGHLTHGYYTAKKKMTASSIYFQSFPYSIIPESGLLNYDGLESQAKIFKPRLIICGASAYPRDWDYGRLRNICDVEGAPDPLVPPPPKGTKAKGAYLMADIAHTSGLVAAKELNDPFEYCDVVTTTTHKTLRGPRAGLIFFRKEADLETRVNQAVFPACQGGPHNHTIAAIATTLKQACAPEWKAYAKQVIANARALAASLVENGYKLQTNGTDNHLVLWDLRPIGLTGSKVEKVCDYLGVTINKNAVSGDKSAQVPGGIRLGTSALTSRDMKEEDMKVVAGFLHRAVQLSLSLQKEANSKLIKDFVALIEKEGETEGKQKAFKEVRDLRNEVRAFASKWPLPGVVTQGLQQPSGFVELVDAKH
ncbi:glycine hydroxymethyltransferase [Flagelloscypha sp. PMI_526]|nr:glycine hydroxymethyltransferase [Flagelloscypha sp. PMI_526]